ncbi:MAG: hypothetical protein SGJ27_23830 [Candidatus Melainabacteria bacterium]|nr:hypothetical protein [Candidatus Melainabacteria bacterium]
MSEFENGWIEIKRTSQHFAKIRTIKIFLDGVEVHGIKDGESKILEVAPGAHTLHAKIDWCKTPEVSIQTVAGETNTLMCGSNITGWKLIFASVLVFIPSQVVYLKTGALELGGYSSSQ